MDAHTVLLIFHIIGTVLGVGSATFIEIFILRFMRDGEVDIFESSVLKTFYTVLRFGLFIAVVSGFGFLIEYRLEGNAQYLFNEALWAKIFIILIIAVNAWFLAAKRIPMWLGSALSFSSWYGALFVGFLIGPIDYGFFEILDYYVLSVAGVAAALMLLRRLLGIRFH